MPEEQEKDELSALEQARQKLYSPNVAPPALRKPLESAPRSLPHEWVQKPLETLLKDVPHKGARRVRFAAVFFAGASAFFLLSLVTAAFFFYFGGNSVSVNNISIQMQGPTTIAGGDTIPLSVAITNRNPVAIENAMFEMQFPEGTRNPDNVLKAYPRYVETIGTIRSGETITRSIKAVVFGGAGDNLILPASLSFGTQGSNSVFVKKTEYALAISSTPLSISVDTLSETVSGKPLTITLTVRSNATVPLSNVVVNSTLPFGFSVTSSSIPLTNRSFQLGTLAPGASKTITLVGTLSGQDSETRTFRFAVGTAKAAVDTAIAVPYMTQEAIVAITAPFINAALTLNGSPANGAVLAAGTQQNVTVSYANTLTNNVNNAVVSVAISGSAVDYDSIRTTTGFYRSSDRTIVFSKDTDPSFASLSPGATGIGNFSFKTVPSSVVGRSPQITFTVSVSGTRVGQSNVPEQVSASSVLTAKVSTNVALSAVSLRSTGPFANSGPIPPQTDQQSTYTVQWNVTNPGNAVAGGTVSATLPSYVTYTGKTSGAGSISYDSDARKITWTIGDIAQNGSATTAFQVSLTPSSSQKGSAPQLTGSASFSGFDRFAGIQVSASAEAVTTETRSEPGYNPTNGSVQ